MTPETIELGAEYVLRKGHPLRKRGTRDVYRYEGEAPGPAPTGWFMHTENQSNHGFRLADVVPKPVKGSKRGRRNRNSTHNKG